jgi:hypothetical protein
MELMDQLCKLNAPAQLARVGQNEWRQVINHQAPPAAEMQRP